MKKLYLAGPIPTKSGWRMDIAREIKEHYQRNTDLTFLDPTKFEVDSSNATETVNLDLNMLKQSDFLLAYVERESTGTAMEICYAKQMNIPVIICCPDEQNLSPWHIYHATKVTNTIRLALDFIVQLLD